MRQYVLAAIIAGISATSAQAIENQKTVCSHGNQTRVIEVVYTGEDTLPCEVRYSKEEGSTTLWSANNLAGFCEDKAASFVQKQKAWGWSCELTAATVSNDETEVSATDSSSTIESSAEVTDPATTEATTITPEATEATAAATSAPVE
jgi:hypothetical protein